MDNPKYIVAQGYDRLTQEYLKLIDSTGTTVRDKYLGTLMNTLADGAEVLELGCGAGIPMTKTISTHFNVTGVDISREQLRLAVSNVPKATFVLADMTQLGFREESFDCIAAFYSITHVPRNEHRALLANIYAMLRPSGLLVATMATRDLADEIDPDWMGAPMFFSHFDGDTNVAIVRDVGFDIVSAVDEYELEYGNPVSFRWIVARKSLPASAK